MNLIDYMQFGGPGSGRHSEGGPAPHTQVKVSSLPKCDFCGKTAGYDGKTTHGPWANMCEDCFGQHGVGLGLGRGQKLVKE